LHNFYKKNIKHLLRGQTKQQNDEKNGCF